MNGGEKMRDVKMGLTIEEAAEMSGIERNTMRKLVDWGKLPVLKVGRKTIIRRGTLESFMTVNQGRNLLNQADVREVR
jgi:excisionase family DNA binding protein